MALTHEADNSQCADKIYCKVATPPEWDCLWIEAYNEIFLDVKFGICYSLVQAINNTLVVCLQHNKPIWLNLNRHTVSHLGAALINNTTEVLPTSAPLVQALRHQYQLPLDNEFKQLYSNAAYVFSTSIDEFLNKCSTKTTLGIGGTHGLGCVWKRAQIVGKHIYAQLIGEQHPNVRYYDKGTFGRMNANTQYELPLFDNAVILSEIAVDFEDYDYSTLAYLYFFPSMITHSINTIITNSDATFPESVNTSLINAQAAIKESATNNICITRSANYTIECCATVPTDRVLDDEKKTEPEITLDTDQPLHQAAHQGDMVSIQTLLTTPQIDVNEPDESEATALVWAADQGHAAIVTRLLAIPEIDVNAEHCEMSSALHCAATEGYVDIVQILLQRSDIDLNVSNDVGNTPLHIAIAINASDPSKTCWRDIIHLLSTDQRCYINQQNKKGETPLHILLGNLKRYYSFGALQSLEDLLTRSDIDLNVCDNNQQSCAQLALTCFCYPYKVIQRFLNHPAATLSVTDAQQALKAAIKANAAAAFLVLRDHLKSHALSHDETLSLATSCHASSVCHLVLSAHQHMHTTVHRTLSSGPLLLGYNADSGDNDTMDCSSTP